MIEVSQEELNAVQEVLENYISNLNMEISHTDSKDYREKLKHKRELLQGALSSFQQHRRSSLDRPNPAQLH